LLIIIVVFRIKSNVLWLMKLYPKNMFHWNVLRNAALLIQKKKIIKVHKLILHRRCTCVRVRVVILQREFKLLV